MMLTVPGEAGLAATSGGVRCPLGESLIALTLWRDGDLTQNIDPIVSTLNLGLINRY